jgi:hypothetical protein
MAGFDGAGGVTTFPALAIGDAVGAGTPGSVLFIDGSSNLGQDNANFFWDDTAKTLRIGTVAGSAPTLSNSGGSLLIDCVAGGANGILVHHPSNAAIEILSTTNGLASIKYWTNATFRFKTLVDNTSNTFITTNAADVAIITADQNKNVVLNSAALATNATDGFLYIAASAGTPTGTPTAFTGRVPVEVDSTNAFIYAYVSGTWKPTAPLNALWTSIMGLATNQFILTANASLTWGSSGVTSPDLFLGRRGPGILSLENGANAQALRVYGTTSGAVFLNVSHDGVNALIYPVNGNQLAFATAAKGLTDTTGYFCIPSSAGDPSGTPSNIPTGQIPYQYNSTANTLWAYNGGWKKAKVGGVDVIFS